MSNLQIKDVPAEVHDELRRRAAQSGMTMREYALELIRRDQAAPSRRDWLDALEALEPVELGRPAAELIGEQRAARAGVESRR